MSQRNYLLILGCLVAVVLGAHLFQLVEIPAGLYLDEASIGYNAALIAQTGTDEHNVFLPTYFKAFGEYKNPIYIYAAALLFRLFGVTEFNLRATSFLFFAVALGLHSLLVARLFPGKKTIQIYAIASFGFLPVFFALSRISFEVISQLTWITAVNLLIWSVFQNNDRFNSKKTSAMTLASLMLGLGLGSSIYTYSTARFLSFLSLALLWILYLKRGTIKRLILITVAFLGSLIPYALFSLRNPGEITKRFTEISYIDDPISPLKKVLIFARNFSEYWSLDFLTVHGDSNLRHSTGYGGIVFLAVFILFLIGLLNIVNLGRNNRFNIFLLLSLAASPVAAALTSEGTPHALRSFLLGYYIVLISCFGLDFILNIPTTRLRRVTTLTITSLLVIEIISYLLHYFLVYSTASIGAMGSYDFTGSLQSAIDRKPKQIAFINNPSYSYANLKFSQFVVANPKAIPLHLSQNATPIPGGCVLFDQKEKGNLDRYPYRFSELESQPRMTLLQRLFNKPPAAGVIRVRCYDDQLQGASQ